MFLKFLKLVDPDTINPDQSINPDDTINPDPHHYLIHNIGGFDVSSNLIISDKKTISDLNFSYFFF